MKIAKIIHRGYGCDCGCCGHAIEIDGVEKAFGLTDHPDPDHVTAPESVEAWAKEFVSYQLTDEELEDVDLEHIDFSGAVTSKSCWGC